MKKTLLAITIASVPLCAFASTSANEEALTVINNQHQTLATLPFDRGFPRADSAKALQSELAFQRATQAYLWALPIVNMRAMQMGHAKMMDGTAYNKIAVYEDRLKAHTLITTPNSDVIYGLAWLDMKETGPLVIELPAGLQSLVDDMRHDALIGPEKEDGSHYAGDLGNAGPDKGKGGLFLLLPPGESRKDYDADKYFIYESKTNEVFLFLRSFFKDMNDTAPAVARMEKTRVFPLKGSPKKMQYVHVSEVSSNSIAPTDWTYFRQLDETVQAEPVMDYDPYMNGILATMGIKKGIEFNPTEQEKLLLTQAVQTGWKMAKEIALNFDQNGSEAVADTTFWKGRHWIAHFLTKNGNQYQASSTTSYNNPETGHTNVDAKAHMYINHYSVSDGMINAKPGAGAKYAGAYKDADGNPLVGQCTYSITLPADVPAALFWSVTAYDAKTAAGVPSNNKYPSIGDRDKPKQNKDGSTTLYFGYELPENAPADNYVHIPETVNWFSLLRLYGPKEPLFTGKWIPGDFEKLSCKK
jgi:hypothetical protein